MQNEPPPLISHSTLHFAHHLTVQPSFSLEYRCVLDHVTARETLEIMMAAEHASSSSRLQQTLQSAVQSVQWTYGLFWQLCPQQAGLAHNEIFLSFY